MSPERAIEIARLWRAGKMLGADEDEVRDALLVRIERLEAFVDKVRASEVEFAMFQDDEFQAGGTGPLEAMKDEAAHYAMMYGQDGPTRTEFYVRVPLEALADLDRETP